jgi:hypothetical protein
MSHSRNHLPYPIIIVMVYTIVGFVGYCSNLAVITDILRGSMVTPNSRFVLILMVGLFLEQIFAFPQIYVHHGELCSVTGALEKYFEMLILCCSVCMAVLAYYQCFK